MTARPETVTKGSQDLNNIGYRYLHITCTLLAANFSIWVPDRLFHKLCTVAAYDERLYT